MTDNISNFRQEYIILCINHPELEKNRQNGGRLKVIQQELVLFYFVKKEKSYWELDYRVLE